MDDDQRSDDQGSDDERAGDERGDSALRRTTTAQNAERVPEPGAHGDADTDEAGETGEEAAGQAERLESHSRPTTQPHEPGAPQTGGDPPLT